jgi:3-hydroxyacyl-CoA dehydrogenase/enoyl-CoA hydratase/3-hydroxybutyryl-CoA epimerase/enoyl-CoA isomerase
MIYEGQAIQVTAADQDGIAELIFDLKDESVNKFNRLTIEDLNHAVEALSGHEDVRGLMITSAKDVFIVGADITEFSEIFDLPEEEIAAWALKGNAVFCALEDLALPTVTLINGIALGGGLELALTTDYRILSEKAEVGLPEVKLGLFPGFGGTVRMPRLIGVDNAVEWIAAGGQHKAPKALADGVVDAVVAPDQLKAAGKKLLLSCMAGKIDYKARRAEKLNPLKLPPMENMMSFQTCTAMVAQKAGKHYPAPKSAVATMGKHATMTRDKALEVEASGFAKMAKTSVASNLIQLFLNDQALKKQSAKFKEQSIEIKQAAVLGAGIMGGGIAYQSAYKGTPIIMKDINNDALDLGLEEASKLLNKAISRGKMDAAKMAKVLSQIRPTLNYGDFADVDVVVEAVVENEKVKSSVLKEVEGTLPETAFLSSNTSTISITKLAEDLKRPERFVGMHFFNPVHRMPLVEVIRGEKTSDEAVAAVVTYARKMGKTPVVVNDCPGFFVNRVLFPYFGGCIGLIKDGCDFQEIDRVMERFGWPMGPAYLMDVVGLDTAMHASAVMAEGYPERMSYEFKDAVTILAENKRFGQKNDIGFYRYELDKKGKPKKLVDEKTYELLKPHVAASKSFTDEEIVARMMVPMCLETIRTLEEKIVQSPMEADMMLIMGLGFPPFLGGAFRYIDQMGLSAFVEMCQKYESLGPLYAPTQGLLEKAKKGETYYG